MSGLHLLGRHTATLWLFATGILGLAGCASETSSPPEDPRVHFDLSWSDSGHLRNARLTWSAHALPSATDTIFSETSLDDDATSLELEQVFAPAPGYRLRFEIQGALARASGLTETGRLFHAETTLVELETFDRLDIALALSPLVPQPMFEVAGNGDAYRLSWSPISGARGYELEETRGNEAPSLYTVSTAETTLAYPPVRISSASVGNGNATSSVYRVRSQGTPAEPLPPDSALSNAYSERLEVPFPDPIPPATVNDLVVLREFTTESAVRLGWTAPGENGTDGRASLYDLRVSTTPLDSVSFFDAPSYRLSPPNQSGAFENRGVLDLASGTTYYFALRTADAARHFSGISNVVSETTLAVPDTLGPAAVDDLLASSTEETAIVLEWTAPADDDGSTVFAYDIRYDTAPIDLMTFDLAMEAPSLPAPEEPGTPTSLRIPNLASEQTYYAAIRSEDRSGNVSELSNIASVTTPDLTSPARITDLAARGATETQVLLTWTAPGDNGRFGIAERYDLRWSLTPLDDANFTFAEAVNGLDPPAPGETFESRALDRTLFPVAVVHLALRTFDNVGNVSDVSNSVQIDLSKGLAR